MFNFVNVPGLANTSLAFRARVVSIAQELETDPNFLMAVMSFESGATFSPSTKNMAGSGATGLIQFMPRTAVGLGTTTAKLAAMTAVEQLEFVRAHFLPFKGRISTIQDCYMAVLMPSAVGKGPDHVLFRKGSVAFKQNAGLDLDGDGRVTVAEAAKKVSDRLGTAPAPTPSLQRGDEGPSVEVIQDEMIDLGYMTMEEKDTGPGIFGPRTERSIKSFQTDLGFEPTGIVDAATQLAIHQLNEGVRRGGVGGLVGVLQQRLVSLGLMTEDEVATGPGIFGPRTERALGRFQLDRELDVTVTLDDETFRTLFRGEAVPTFDPAADNTDINVVLPGSGVGYTTYSREVGGVDQVGTERTVNAIISLAHEWAMKHPEVKLQFGDISRPGGGRFPPHSTHRDGRDVDMRPIRTDNRHEPVTIGSHLYDSGRTRDFVKMIRAKHPRIKILFNDSKLVQAGLTRHVRGHHNHLHLRFF